MRPWTNFRKDKIKYLSSNSNFKLLETFTNLSISLDTLKHSLTTSSNSRIPSKNQYWSTVSPWTSLLLALSIISHKFRSIEEMNELIDGKHISKDR